MRSDKKLGNAKSVKDMAEALIERGWSTKRVLWAVRRAVPAARTTITTVEAWRCPQQRMP